MHTLIAVLVVATAVCAIALPPGPSESAEFMQSGSRKAFLHPSPDQRFYKEYLLPQDVPRFIGYEESPRVSLQWPEMPTHDWLNKEIDRIHQMKAQEESLSPYETHLSPWVALDFMKRLLGSPSRLYETRSYKTTDYGDQQSLASQNLVTDETFLQRFTNLQKEINKNTDESKPIDSNKKRKEFAFTPLDKEYFEHTENNYSAARLSSYNGPHEGGDKRAVIEFEPPRKIRQNPNLSRTKTLVAENLDRLRTGVYNKDYRIPVSLLPTNLRWLKINHPDDDYQNVHDKESSHEETDATDKPRHFHVLETTRVKPEESLFGVALITAVGASITMAVVGFAFGWYILTKKAKAAADVDYPAYGVTGPTIDTSGDRKLAHSAHMYHYQHQKQQIIAMERNGLEQRNGSVSDPESEEENEEGDYTVYECPGFATTGDMEVRNPLFTEETTPATPGKCQVVKQQPKE